jgi:peptidoglycan/LPS O-acetylase OafA/YrhL
VSDATVSGDPARKAERFPALDGFRALAMLSIFFFHAWLPISQMVFAKVQPFPGVIWRGNSVIVNFDTGVAMFFALSGFLIYRPFAAAHLGGRPEPGLAHYARRRAWRIYPAYWVIFVVLLASGEFVHITFTQVIANLALVQTWFNFSARSGIGQAWTLVVEVAFYAFVPLWASLIRYAGRGRNRARCEITGATLLTLVGFAASALDAKYGVPRWFATFLPHLAALAPGMLLAIINVRAEEDEGVRRQCARYARYPVLWWAAATVVFWILCAQVAANPYFTLNSHGLGWQGMLQPIIAILMIAPLVLSPGTASRLVRTLSLRPIAWIGTISFGAYLWHARVLELNFVRSTMRHGGAGRGYPAIITGTLLGLALTLMAGAASWYAIERPLLNRAQRREPRSANL